MMADTKKQGYPRKIGLGSAEAVGDLKALLLKHFNIRDDQNWSRVCIEIDYDKNVLRVDQELVLIAPVAEADDEQ